MANRNKEEYQAEIAQLKNRIKELEQGLAFSRLQTEARDLMITRAEEYFNIPIRKKIWGQIVSELVSRRNMKVALACRLFGHCRRSFYQSRSDMDARIKRERAIVDAVHEIRGEDLGIGCRKLWIMLTVLFGEDFMPGRDSFFALLRQYRLMLPPRKSRCTTNTNHRYHKWKNLIKGFLPASANRLWVSDITYIPLAEGGVCYLHLITDAYSHMIVGWVVSDTLRASVTADALRQAIRQAVSMTGSEDLTGLIHHLDRGVQYEDYSPTDNAIAERVNGIIKSECVYRRDRFDSVEHAREVIGRYIHESL